MLSSVLVILSCTCTATLVQARRLEADNTAESFGNFSLKLVRDLYSTEGIQDAAGVGLVYPLGLGQLLAVIATKTWDLDTQGFDKFLHMPAVKISDSYGGLLASLKKDPGLTLHSTIYTSREGMLPSPALQTLNTGFSFLDYNETEKIQSNVDVINGKVAEQTFGQISGSLVPKGGWWGAPFAIYTQGVITNTFHLRARLAGGLRRAFKAPFTNETKLVTFLEINAVPLKPHTDTYQGVRITLENSGKSLVLILPRVITSEFVTRDLNDHLEYENSNRGVNSRNIRVQIPKMDFTISNTYIPELEKSAVAKALCRNDKDTKNSFTPPKQSTRISLDKSLELRISSATGNNLYNVEAFRAFHGIDSDHNPEEEMEAEAKASSGGNVTNLTRSTLKSRSDKTASAHTENLIAFNRPFFFYLDDPAIGPIFFGSVESFDKYESYANPVVSEGFEWLHDAAKFALWSCR